jgi:hypothetical protein
LAQGKHLAREQRVGRAGATGGFIDLTLHAQTMTTTMASGYRKQDRTLDRVTPARDGKPRMRSLDVGLRTHSPGQLPTLAKVCFLAATSAPVYMQRCPRPPAGSQQILSVAATVLLPLQGAAGRGRGG